MKTIVALFFLIQVGAPAKINCRGYVGVSSAGNKKFIPQRFYVTGPITIKDDIIHYSYTDEELNTTFVVTLHLSNCK